MADAKIKLKTAVVAKLQLATMKNKKDKIAALRQGNRFIATNPC